MSSDHHHVAVLWMRFGPYHHARLVAATEAFATEGYQVVGLQVADRDQYAWTPGGSQTESTRITTLFPGTDYDTITATRIRRAVRAALDAINPCAVAINGWSVPEARAALSWSSHHRRRAILFSETAESDATRVWWKEAIKRRIVRQFDGAVVGGQPHVNYAIKLGIPTNHVFKGYDVVDNDHFAHGADAARTDAATLRAARRLPERYVYANTRFLPRKNIAGLLRAFQRYRQEVMAPWDLVITGSGETEDADRALAARLGIAASVHWCGFVQYDELPALYGLASAFIHPALTEPWGLVINEACAAGLPLLASTTVGATSELLEEGTNGFSFDPAIDDAISAALIRMHNLSDAQRRAMAQTSRRIVANWGPTRFADALHQALALPPPT